MNTHQQNWLTFAPVIFLILWSGGFVAAKLGLAYTEPFTFLVLRFGLIVVIMTILFIVLKPPLPKTTMEWVHLTIVGLLLQSLYFAMSYMVFESGAAVVIVAHSEINTPTIAACLFGFLTLLGITVGSLWEKRFGVSHHPVTANLIGYSAGLIGVLPFMLLMESMQVNWTWEFVASLTYLIIGSSLIGIGLLLAMIRAGDVSRVSALFFLVPPLAVIGVFIATHQTKTQD